MKKILFVTGICFMNGVSHSMQSVQAVKKDYTPFQKAWQRQSRITIPVEKVVFDAKNLATDYIQISRYNSKKIEVPKPEAIAQLLKNTFPFLQGTNKQVEVKALFVQAANTLRLYVVSAFNETTNQRQNVFFVKLSTKAGSAERLQKIQKKYIGKKLIQGRYAVTNISKKDLPIMTWVEHIFTYNELESGEQRVLEVTHAAHGQDIESILESDAVSKTDLMACGYRVGLTLGSFQQLFMNYKNSNDPKDWTTVCHGDLHYNNVFFDKKTSKVYYIDNETMQDGCSIYRDLFAIVGLTKKYMINPYGSDVTEKQMGKYKTYSESFFKGYIASYKNFQRQVQIAQYLLRSDDQMFNDASLLSRYKQLMSTTTVSPYNLLIHDNNEIKQYLQNVIERSIAQQKAEVQSKQDIAATQIQTAWRSKFARNRLAQLRQARAGVDNVKQEQDVVARKIQSAWRKKIDRRSAQRELERLRQERQEVDRRWQEQDEIMQDSSFEENESRPLIFGSDQKKYHENQREMSAGSMDRKKLSDLDTNIY